jgi:hypothetical protein
MFLLRRRVGYMNQPGNSKASFQKALSRVASVLLSIASISLPLVNKTLLNKREIEVLSGRSFLTFSN